MGACLFVAELASTALAAGWLGVRGLGGRAQASWVAGRAWTRWLGASGLGGWVQAERAAASSEKTSVKGKAIQHRGGNKPGRGRKSASLLKICGSSKA